MTELATRQAGRRALVTGATGYIGRQLAELLVKDGWDVHVIARKGSRLDDIKTLDVTVHIDSGVVSLSQIIDAAQPSVCFHLAGYFVGMHKSADVNSLIESNLLFGTRLADALAEAGGCYFVNAGTYWQNAGGSDYHPVALYAATKQAFQDILQYYAEAGRLQVISLKFFETYGPSDKRPKLVNLLMNAALSGEIIGVSPGNQLIDIVHVEDVARACLVAAAQFPLNPPETLQTYAVSSGDPIRMVSLVERISRCIGIEIPVQFGVREYRWREMMEPWQVAPPLPGWTPTVDLEEGIMKQWQALSVKELSK